MEIFQSGEKSLQYLLGTAVGKLGVSNLFPVQCDSLLVPCLPQNTTVLSYGHGGCRVPWETHSERNLFPSARQECGILTSPMLALRVKILLFQAYSSIMERKYFFIKKKQSGGQIFLLSALHWERETVDLGEKYLGWGWLLSVCVVLRTARVWCWWGPCELLWEFTVRNPHADLIPCLRDIQFFPCWSREKLWKESSLYPPKKPQRTWCGIMPWYVPSSPPL